MRLLLAALLAVSAALPGAETVGLLNASYDITREFYRDVNEAFARSWRQRSGQAITVDQSHGGSTKQARAVIDGLAADVVTMNQASDIDRIAKARLLPAEWRDLLPNGAVPSTSTILFVVRKGNPKGIADWGDLAKPGVSVVIPNPKTSGNGRYSYLAAWAWAKRAYAGDEKKAEAFVAALFANVPVLDTGGRGATTTFAQRGIGDVLLTFEAEVQLIVNDVGGAGLQAVVPSLSIRAENPVAVVEKVARKRGTEAAARAYLEFLFGPEGQELAAKHHFRPSDPAVLARHAADFPALELVTVDEAVGGWDKAFAQHFNDGGIADRILTRR